MSLFDYVEYEAECWKCGKPLHEFQTKDGDLPQMATLKPDDVERFYTYCRECGAWNEFQVFRPIKPEDVHRVLPSGATIVRAEHA